MSTFLTAAFLAAVFPGNGAAVGDAASRATNQQSAVASEEPPAPPRTGAELRGVARATLRRWARVDDKHARLAAREFLVLYRELQADDKLARTQRERLHGKVRGRLMALGKQIAKRIAIERRLAKQKRPESVDAAARGNDVLGQVGPFGGFGGQGRFGGRMDGPAMANDDNGQELVGLIQKTIAPSTWDINGGPGTIHYWRPGRAIVVRQMGDVHDQIGDLLEQMNRLGP